MQRLKLSLRLLLFQFQSLALPPLLRPTKVGRVLDDGSTQLYTYAYDGFGHVTNSIDPAGRTFSYLYAANGIDLLEMRQDSRRE